MPSGSTGRALESFKGNYISIMIWELDGCFLWLSFKFNLVFNYVYMCVVCVGVPVPAGARGVGISGAEVTGSCALPDLAAENRAQVFQKREQEMLLTSEPAAQPFLWLLVQLKEIRKANNY